MGNAELGPLTLRATVLVRELENGDTVAVPLAAPGILAHGEDEDEVLLELALYLREHLSKIAADQIASFVLPESATLIEVPCALERADLPSRLRKMAPLVFPCVLVPQPRASWVIVPALAHTFYVPHNAALEQVIEEEIVRMVAARDPGPLELLALMPARGHELIWLDVELVRAERGNAGDQSVKREELAKRRRLDAARKLLNEVGSPLHLSAHTSAAPPLLYRDREMAVLRAMLDGEVRLSVAVLGPELCGKSAMVRALLTHPTHSLRHGVWATSGAQLIAGQSGFGQWQKRLHQVMEAAHDLDAILYFDDLSDLFSGQVGGMMDLAGAMRPWIEANRVRIVGELTQSQLELYEHRHVGFFAALQRLPLAALDAQQTREVVRAHVSHHLKAQPSRPTLADEAIRPLVELAERYLPYRSFPGKAVRLVEELRAAHDTGYLPDGKTPRIAASQVFEAFSAQTGIPVFLLREDEALKREELVAALGKRVIGQQESIARIADTLCVVKAALQPPSRPLATFLFVGPTGVGKTEVTRALAELLFGGPDRMIRFDMSEYIDAYAAERLIHGIGGEDGLLTRKVRQQPFCVVLLDEIEKAHPAVFDLLLQVLGEGRLTDARGRTAYFHNAMIIMTSNLGATVKRELPGFGDRAAGAAEHYGDQVDRHFRPEFVNRLDKVVAFSSLDADQIRHVLDLLIERIALRQGLAEERIRLDLSDAARALLAREGYSPRYGARALRRFLDEQLVTPLASLLARHTTAARHGALRVTTLDEEAPTLAQGEAEEEAQPSSPAPRQGALLGTERSALLCVTLRRGVGRASSRELRGVDEVLDARRQVARWLQLPRIKRLGDQIDFIFGQLTYGRKRKRDRDAFQREVAQYQTEHHRLTELIRPLHAALGDLEAVEEIAIAAMLDGEPLREYVAEASGALERASIALFYALRGLDEQRDGVTLLVRRVDDEGGVVLWLSGLLAAIQARGWRASFHLDGGQPSFQGRWSVSHDAAWMTERLELVAKERHNFLVMVRGADAATILALEAGLQQFEEVPGRKTPAQVYIELMRLAGDLEIKDWSSPLVQIGALDHDTVKRMKPVRHFWLDQGRVRSGRTQQVIEQTLDEYWARPELLGVDDMLYHSLSDERWASIYVGTLDAVDAWAKEDDIPF
jgi:ATP-dependent Clp protease ATP-binding subunit ClpC